MCLRDRRFLFKVLLLLYYYYINNMFVQDVVNRYNTLLHNIVKNRYNQTLPVRMHF